MKEIEKFTQELLIKQNRRLLHLILFGCGGVIFQSHFFSILGKKDYILIKKLRDNRLIRIKKIGKNNVVILKYAVFCYFKLPNKSVKLNADRLLHSALLCEMLLHTHDNGEIDKMDNMLRFSNFQYFSYGDSASILRRIYNYLENRLPTAQLNSLIWAVAALEQKTDFMQASTKGRKETFKEQLKYDDLLVLRSNNIYVHHADARDNAIRLHMTVFATNKDSDKICEAIRKTEQGLSDAFGDLNIEIFFDILSLSSKSAVTEKRVFQKLIQSVGNELREDYYRATVTFRWYDCKRKLFSGIDINKWL